MSIIIFIIVLAFLILVHEFGHFIVAKKAGIKVDEFGLGFPPKIWGYKPKGSETEYTLNLLPIGGFVKILGEDPTDEEAQETRNYERSMLAKSKVTQVAVMGAGVVLNIVSAWILFSIAFMVGFPAVAPSDLGEVENVVVQITDVLPESSAELAEIPVGEVVESVSIGGETVVIATAGELQNFVSQSGGETVTLTGKEGVYEVTPVFSEELDRYIIGVSLGELGVIKLSFFQSIWKGFLFTGEIIGRVAIGLGTLIKDAVTGQADLDTVAGPVGLVGLVGNATALGFVHLITFTALISINLALINLVPFPALDGGRILFVLIEAVKGSPINPKVAQRLNTAGFVLLLLLMAVITWSDIAKIVTG